MLTRRAFSYGCGLSAVSLFSHAIFSGNFATAETAVTTETPTTETSVQETATETPSEATATGCQFTSTDDSVVITAAGQPFVTYLSRSNTKPILYRLFAPNGKPVTRAWPMDETVPGEAHDHPHQRSFWFSHGNVNGVSFWDEMPTAGTITETSRQVAQSGERVLLVTTNAWRGPKDSDPVLLTDVRHTTFWCDPSHRWNGIDFQVTLRAVVDPVVFGDTKEGTFGIRVWEEMRADRKENPGRIENTNGLTNDDAWGKRSPWVDYRGSVQDSTAGITIMNHPSSFRFPTWWHVRSYGLFAANPFGIGDFTGEKNHPGDYTLPKDHTMTFGYRVLLHDGTLPIETIRQAYENYAS